MSSSILDPASLQPLTAAADPYRRQSTISAAEKIKLKKELGLLEGVAIIIGIIIGSGEGTFAIVTY